MGRALERRSKDFTPLVVAQLASIEEDLGGREALVQALVLAPMTKDLKHVLGMLGDPTFSRNSLAEICAAGNILPGHLLGLIEQSALQRGKIKSAQIIGKALPAVVANVMERAAPYEAPCTACQGTGSITPDPTPQVSNPQPAPCEICRGTGRLEYQPNIRHQELALEMARMLPKGGGLVINNANVQGAGGSMGAGTLEKLMAISDEALYGDVSEGEVLPEDDNG